MTHLLEWKCVERPEGLGTLIRHAGELAGAIGTLVVAVIEASFLALLVARASRPTAVDACRGAALGTAIDVAAVAVPTDRERLLAHAAGQQQMRTGARVRRSIPEPLLRAAVALLDCYTPSTICRRLRLNAARLGRARQALKGTHAQSAAADGAFVELPALGVAAIAPQARLIPLDALGQGTECRVVLETAAGGRLSVELARVDAAWLEVVCRSLLAASAGQTIASPDVKRTTRLSVKSRSEMLSPAKPITNARTASSRKRWEFATSPTVPPRGGP